MISITILLIELPLNFNNQLIAINCSVHFIFR